MLPLSIWVPFNCSSISGNILMKTFRTDVKPIFERDGRSNTIENSTARWGSLKQANKKKRKIANQMRKNGLLCSSANIFQILPVI